MSTAVDFSVKSTLEAFEVVVKHLLSQKQRAVSFSGDCAYRGEDDLTEYPSDGDYNYDDIDMVIVPNGLMCAVGVLIREPFYDPQIEGNDIEDDWVQKCVKESHPDWEITSHDFQFLKMLQCVHDKHFEQDWASFFMFMINNYISIVDGDLSWNFDGHYEMLLAEYRLENSASRSPEVNDTDVFAAIDNLKGQANAQV